MSGLCGFTGNFSENNGKIINKMLESIKHRGPNGTVLFSDDNINLGFCKLSSFELDNNQCLRNEDGTLALFFDGKLYNSNQLRKELVSKGHVFKTNDENEVILHLFEEYGNGLVHHLRGMFAFTIYDSKDNSLFVARDLFGIKPFYYGIFNNSLIFASESKAILRHPFVAKQFNQTALEHYMSFQYNPCEETFFKGIFKLPPAHFLTFKNSELHVERYWHTDFKPNESLTLDEVVEQINKAVSESIKTHEAGDKEVGSFLSSGVDSSYMAATFSGSKTFTVGFNDEKYNEIEYAKDLSEKLDVEHFYKVITPREFWDNFPTMQYHLDEPLADPAAAALYFVSKLAREHVEVVFSGEGADEFFGGYNIYREPFSMKKVAFIPFPLRKLVSHCAKILPKKLKGRSFLIRAGQRVEEKFIGNANIFSEKEKSTLLKTPLKTSARDITRPLYEKIKHYDDVTKMQYIDLNLWLVGDILQKADKISMAHSLEVRPPLLDKNLFEIASRLPLNLRVTSSQTKKAFRLAANKHLDTLVANKKKLGFPVPTRVWLKDDIYYRRVKSAFQGEVAKKYFNVDYILKLLEKHKLGKVDNSRKIWTVFTFLTWYDQYFKD